MKINLHMICGRLPYGQKRVCGERAKDFDILGWRLYSPEKTPSGKYLYVVDQDNLTGAAYSNPDSFFICALDDTVQFNRSMPGNLLLINDKATIEELEERLTEVFESFHQWESDMNDAMFGNASLQDFFEIAARFLRNPVALFDLNGGLLVRVGDFGDRAAGTLWEHIEETGFSPPDEGMDMEAYFNKLRTTREPFFLRTKSGKFTSFNRIICPLHYNGKLFAILGTQDYYEPLSTFDLSILTVLKSRMEFTLRHREDYSQLLDGTSVSVNRLFAGEFLPKDGLNSLLEAWGKRKNEQYYVLVFRGAAAHGREIRKNIRQMFNDARLYCPDGHVAVVCYDADLLENKTLLKQLEMVAHRRDIPIGISSMQDSLENLRIGYLQAQIASENQLTSRVALFSSSFLPHLAKSMAGSPYCAAMLFPGFLEQLWDKSAYSLELVSTLRQYLLANGNLSVTAAVLHIHRHTAEYRIAKVEQLLGIQLSKLPEIERVQLYLSCLYAEYEMPN